MLLFSARSFRWQPGGEDAATSSEERVGRACVAFCEIEVADLEAPARAARRATKWLKWFARKRRLDTLVLHSFAHLGGQAGDPEGARAFLLDVAGRLRRAGFEVRGTPFGVSCGWNLDCEPDGGAKVFVASDPGPRGHGACERAPNDPRQDVGDPPTGRRA